MTTKRIEYVPAVETVGDLPSPDAFQSGVAIYVQSLQAFVATDGATTWTIITGGSRGTEVP